MAFRNFTELETRAVFIDQKEYSKATARRIGTTVSEVTSILPFRVRFKNLEFGVSSSNSTPAIGVMVIGSTFYIL
jgi:hypothetical protein